MATELSIVISASAMIGGAMSALKTLTGGIDSVKRSASILGGEHRRLGREIERLSSHGRNVDDLRKKYEKLGSTMLNLRKNAVVQTRLDTAIENNRNARSQMQGEVMGILGAGLALTAPVKLAIDFESSMADVKKVVDFGDNPVIAKQQVAELSDEILKLSSIRPMSASDIAQIVALGGQSGIARDQLMKFADDAVKMGVAFDASAEQAGQSMAEMRTAFGMNQAQVVALADQINHLGNSTPAAAKSIMEIVQRVGAFGEVAGSSAGAIAAVGATIRGMGVADEVAATGIKNLFLALGKGENATKSQKAAWQKLGLNHEQIAKDMQTNAEETTLKVLESIAKLEKHEQGQVLESLFGSESLLAIAPLLSQLETLKGNLDKVADSTQYAGSMNKEYEARAATTANNIQTLKNQVMHLGISIGSVVLPALSGLINDLKPVIEKVIAFAKANPQLIATLFKVGAALFAFKAGSLATRFAFNLLFGGLLSGYRVLTRIAGAFRVAGAAVQLLKMNKAASALRLFGLSAKQARAATKLFSGGLNLIKSRVMGFVSFVKKAIIVGKAFGSSLIQTGLAFAKSLMGMAKVMLNVGRAMLTNPIVLIGVLIAGVAYLIYKNWDTIKPMLVGFWNDITQAASNAWQWIVGIWNGLSAWFGGLWNGISTWASNAWMAVVTGASAAWGWLVGIWSGAVAWFGGLWASVQAVAVAVWNGITGFISSVWETIKSLSSGGIMGLIAIIARFSPVGLFIQAFSAVWSFFGGLVGRFHGFGQNIIQGLIGGIKSMAGAVMSAISGAIGGGIRTAKRMLGINSPSRVFRQFGSWVSEGLSIGIDKGGHKPITAIGKVATGVSAGFGAKMGNLSAHISTSLGEHQARMANTNATNANNLNNQQQGNITIHYNPTINATGADRGKIETALQLSQREFEKMFARMQADKLRRAY